MRHADERSRQVFVGEANGLEHGPGGRAVRAIGKVTTVVFQGIAHGSLTPVRKNPSALRLWPAHCGTISGSIHRMIRKTYGALSALSSACTLAVVRDHLCQSRWLQPNVSLSLSVHHGGPRRQQRRFRE